MRRNAMGLILTGVALVGLGAGAGYWLAKGHGTKQDAAANSGAAAATSTAAPAATASSAEKIDPKTGRKVLYWHDPMVPGPKFDKAGKSPFMDMELVPVYADEAGAEGKVSISPRTAQNLGIRTAQVKQGDLAMRFSAVGVVSVDERMINTVQSRVTGYIERLYVRAQYDQVVRGQPLAEIYAPDWLAAEEEYLALKSSTQPGAEELAQAARQRLLLLGISERQLEAIDRDGKANARVTLFAPESGVVWELGARDGMAVSPGMTLFKLAGLSTVWVNAEVPETQSALVKPGIAVEGRTAAFPHEVFKGKVSALLPDVNATTRTLRARIVLANPKARLKPGMFATLDLGGQQTQALMVPTEAVIYTGTRNVVILADSNGAFRPIDVEVGRESGDMIEVRKGLEPGQKVVVSGQFLIDSEASLKTTLDRMNAGEDGVGAAPAMEKHKAQGRVTAIEGDRVTIQHGAIASAKMGAMTMPFKAPPSGVPRNLAVGDQASFEFSIAKSGEFQLTWIAPTPEVTPQAPNAATGQARQPQDTERKQR